MPEGTINTDAVDQETDARDLQFLISKTQEGANAGDVAVCVLSRLC